MDVFLDEYEEVNRVSCLVDISRIRGKGGLSILC